MKAAVIGIGNKGWRGGVDGPYMLGQTHVGAILETPGLKLVAVADIDVDLLQSFSDWGLTTLNGDRVEAFTDYQDMMYTKPDIVAVVTPPNTHAQIAKNLMRYDFVKCIVLEKPACTYGPAGRKEGMNLLNMQREFGTPIIVNHSRRYMANWKEFIQKAKKLTPKYAVGFCNGDPMDAGVHMFDLFNWLNTKHVYVGGLFDVCGKYKPYIVFDVMVYCEDGVVAMMNNGHTLIEVPIGKGTYRDLQEAIWDEAKTGFHFDQMELEKGMGKMYQVALVLAEGKRKRPTCSLKDGVRAVWAAGEYGLRRD